MSGPPLRSSPCHAGMKVHAEHFITHRDTSGEILHKYYILFSFAKLLRLRGLLLRPSGFLRGADQIDSAFEDGQSSDRIGLCDAAVMAI